MANLRCSIWVYKKVDGKWRYCKPQVGRNNKIVPEDGTYYIRWRQGSKLVWRKSSSAANAVADAKRQEAYLNAYAHGLTPKQEWELDAEKSQGTSDPRIRCPLFGWTPRKEDRWFCDCGNEWNAFDTGITAEKEQFEALGKQAFRKVQARH